MTRRQILPLLLLLTLLLPLHATTPTDDRLLDRVRVNSTVRVDRESNQLELSLDLILDDVSVRSNDLLILTPKIIRPDGSYTRLLQPVYITGGSRERMLSRQLHFDHLPDYYRVAEPQSITRRHNGRPQVVSYSATIPFDERMRGAVLTLDQWLTGCAECDGGGASMTICSPIVKVEPYKPVYKVAYIEPQPEPIKTRSDKYSASIAFRLDKDRIDRGYKSNASILDEVDRKVESILEDRALTLTGMTIEGWASPEATEAYNRSLSQRRAEAFADHLSRTYGIRRADMTVRGCGEDWPGVERLVRASHLEYKSDLLAILDKYKGDARDPQIRALRGGAAFRELASGIYAKVRRTDYTLTYTVRAFDLEEARERLRTSPRLLSLNEMYIVAGSYPADSKEYKEVFRIAAEVFPDDPVALNNVAATLLEEGKVDEALETLRRISGETPETLNNIAIAHALLGESDEAKRYFEEARTRGDKAAEANLAELERVLKRQI